MDKKGALRMRELIGSETKKTLKIFHIKYNIFMNNDFRRIRRRKDVLIVDNVLDKF